MSAATYAIHLTFTNNERPKQDIEYGDEPLIVAEKARWFANMSHIKTVRVSMFHDGEWRALPRVNSKLRQSDKA